jgi:eukaryotic-like serine/threonine-protein kinase
MVDGTGWICTLPLARGAAVSTASVLMALVRPKHFCKRAGVISRCTGGGTVMSPTPDGRFLVVAVEAKETGIDLWLLPLTGGTKPVPLLQQDFDQIDGRVSPDGRWLAYVSNESGTNELFIRPLKKDSTTGVPVAGSHLLVSSGGGRAPRWRKDGRELFYQSIAGAVMSVVVDAASIGKPSELFRAAGIQTDWSVSADGQRFLVATPSRESAPAFTVVVNWQSTLRR